MRSQGGEAEELKARGMPLDLMPSMSYEENVLNVGEAALFYSDGLVEAHDPQRKMFGFPRLKTLLAKHGDEEEALGELLMEELRRAEVGAGGRHHHPYAEAFRIPKLNF
jgi:serine phosphatase RsbU (regulator of sigma subunit)